MSEKGEDTLHRVAMISVIFIFIFFRHSFIISFPNVDSGEKTPWETHQKNLLPRRWGRGGLVSSPGDANAVLRSGEHGGACVAA